MTRFASLLGVLFIAAPAFSQARNVEPPQVAVEESSSSALTSSTRASEPASKLAPRFNSKPAVGIAAKFASDSAPAVAQGANPVSVSAKIDQTQLKPGQTAKLFITAKLEPGWHLYALTQPAPPRAAKVTIDESGVFKLDGAVQQPKPKTYKDPNFSQPGEPPFMSQAFENEVTFTAPIKVASEAQAGAQKLIAKFSYQACDDQTCLRPTTKTFEIETKIVAAAVKAVPSQTSMQAPTPVPVKQAVLKTNTDVNPVTPAKTTKPNPIATPQAATPQATPEATPEPSPTPNATPQVNLGMTSQGKNPPPPSSFSDDELAKDLKNRGLFGFIGFAILQGLLALLTPCVFPMIPITVSFFTKRDQKTSGAAVGQAAFFSSGIIFTYTALGLALAAFAGPTGLNKLASSAWMNLILTLLFVLFALNLFGMFEIKIPSGLVSKLDAKAQAGQGGTTFASILMGITFTLTSFTCTTAFVGTVLIYATRGDWFWAVIGMLGFASAFAMPFFLFALFPRWLSSLPKSGGWLNSVKVVMGFVELAAAFKFLSNVDLVWGWNTVSRNLVLAAWISLALVAAIYLLGKIQLPHDTPVKNLGVLRMLFATTFFAATFYLLTGLFGAPLGEIDAWLPPAENGRNGSLDPKFAGMGGSGISGAAISWVESYESALEKARAENKPVFLNFTGVTCTNCRWMEKNMFPDPLVKKELDRFILAELYTDRETTAHQAADEKNAERQTTQFGSAALPLYAIISPDEKTLAIFPSLTRDKQEFISFLQRGANRFGQQTAQR
jgi:thiol:disulfide interchange protein DsbD